MKMMPLGVGGAFTKKFYQSNLVFILGNRNVLIDAGTTIRYSLNKAGLDETDIHYILTTHFHHDHAGGLAELLTKCYWRFVDGKHVPHKPRLLLRSSQMADIHSMLSPALNNQDLTWKDYCHPIEMTDDSIVIGQYELSILITDNLHCQGLNSFGLQVTDLPSGANVIITGDIKVLEKSGILDRINEKTEAIIQDISLVNNPTHATVKEVMNYYPANIHPYIYGIHYEDHVHPSETYPIKLLEQGKTLSIKKQS